MSLSSLIVNTLKVREEEILRKLKEHNKKDFYRITVRGKYEEIPVIYLDKNIPIYRMNNGRTRSQQKSYIKIKKLKEDYFSSNFENEEQQLLQHKFLFDLATTTDSDLYQLFKKKKELDKTHDPFLIDKDGTVINGNRRLSAIRELYQDAPETYGTFKNIPCAIITSDLSEIDREEIEDTLQIKKSHKLEYSWINELLKIKYQIDLRKKDTEGNQQDDEVLYAEIAKSMGLEGNSKSKLAKEVEERLNRLDFVEQYLDETGQSGNYDAVKDSQQFFTDITKRIKALSKNQDGGAHISTARKLAIMIIKLAQKRKMDGRAYNFNTFFSDRDKLLETCEYLLPKFKGGKEMEELYLENKSSDENLLGETIKTSNQMTLDERFTVINRILPEINFDDKRLAGSLSNIKDQLDRKKNQNKYVDDAEKIQNDLEFIRLEFKNITSKSNQLKIKNSAKKIKEIAENIIKLN